jgi:hypothetical protein
VEHVEVQVAELKSATVEFVSSRLKGLVEARHLEVQQATATAVSEAQTAVQEAVKLVGAVSTEDKEEEGGAVLLRSVKGLVEGRHAVALACVEKSVQDQVEEVKQVLQPTGGTPVKRPFPQPNSLAKTRPHGAIMKDHASGVLSTVPAATSLSASSSSSSSSSSSHDLKESLVLGGDGDGEKEEEEEENSSGTAKRQCVPTPADSKELEEEAEVVDSAAADEEVAPDEPAVVATKTPSKSSSKASKTSSSSSSASSSSSMKSKSAAAASKTTGAKLTSAAGSSAKRGATKSAAASSSAAASNNKRSSASMTTVRWKRRRTENYVCVCVDLNTIFALLCIVFSAVHSPLHL